MVCLLDVSRSIDIEESKSKDHAALEKAKDATTRGR